MRVLVVDSQTKVRSALCLLLEQEPGIDVVGATDEAENLFTQVQQIRPELVLLDWSLPGLSINGLMPALRLLCPHLKVIVLSGRPEARRAALNAGADAFVSKADPPERLLAALQTVEAEIKGVQSD